MRQEQERDAFWETDDDEDGANAARDEKARALQEEQTTTSTLEQHYYHMHEVWCCLYTRKTIHHLRDPNNTNFNNTKSGDNARKRQISLFESLMQTSLAQLHQTVKADLDNKCCAKLQVSTLPWQESSSFCHLPRFCLSNACVRANGCVCSRWWRSLSDQ
eukprot:COSAG06_NODE_54_length_27948_cov_234.398671_23_plen_160_part_00